MEFLNELLSDVTDSRLRLILSQRPRIRMYFLVSLVLDWQCRVFLYICISHDTEIECYENALLFLQRH